MPAIVDMGPLVERYGELGREFAEAHHVIPLRHLRSEKINSTDCLITVCANCRRMLHLMEGTADDIESLQQSVRR
jgi:5-methylcytosine-specific restriction enzyme A